MPALLPGYRYESGSGRYRSLATGRYVARRTIVQLLSDQLVEAEQRAHDLTTAAMAGEVSPAVWALQMRDEVRRQVLIQEALGAGGFDRLTPRHYGRAGRDLRDIYSRISGTSQDMADGRVTVAQALVRVGAYVGVARRHFYMAERETVQRTSASRVVIERRMLGVAARHCASCVRYAQAGWQPFATLPPPGSDTECRGNCRCHLERREVDANEVGEWIGTRRA